MSECCPIVVLSSEATWKAVVYLLRWTTDEEEINVRRHGVKSPSIECRKR